MYLAYSRSLPFLGMTIILLHLAAMAWLISFYTAHDIDFAKRVNAQDSGEYIELANSMITNGRFVLSDASPPETFRTPGYPAFVAALLLVSGGSFYFLFVAQSILVAAIAWCTYSMARAVELPERYALVIGTLFGISPAVVLMTLTGMGGDILYTFLYVLATLLLFPLAERPTWRRAIAIGALLGLATLVRPIGLYMSLLILAAPLLLIQPAPFHTRMAYAGLIGVGFAACTLPWMIRNEIAAGHFDLSSIAAYNVTYYNLPEFLAYKHGTGVEEERTKILASFPPLPYGELRSFPQTHAMREIARETFAREGFVSYLIFHSIKTVPFFLGSGLNVTQAIITGGRPDIRVPLLPSKDSNLGNLVISCNWKAVAKDLAESWPVTIERLSWVALFALAFLAPLLSRGRLRLFFLLFLAIICANAFLTSPVTQPRYRIPAEPFIWVAAGYTIATLYPRIQRWVIVHLPWLKT